MLSLPISFAHVERMAASAMTFQVTSKLVKIARPLKRSHHFFVCCFLFFSPTFSFSFCLLLVFKNSSLRDNSFPLGSNEQLNPSSRTHGSCLRPSLFISAELRVIGSIIQLFKLRHLKSFQKKDNLCWRLDICSRPVSPRMDCKNNLLLFPMRIKLDSLCIPICCKEGLQAFNR